MRQHQLNAFIHIWENKGDILMCLPTDYSKSLVYQLAAPLLKLYKKRDKRECYSHISTCHYTLGPDKYREAQRYQVLQTGY